MLRTPEVPSFLAAAIMSNNWKDGNQQREQISHSTSLNSIGNSIGNNDDNLQGSVEITLDTWKLANGVSPTVYVGWKDCDPISPEKDPVAMETALYKREGIRSLRSIRAERIPPSYHGGIQGYFDDLEKTIGTPGSIGSGTPEEE